MSMWFTVLCVAVMAGTAFKLGPEYFVCYLAGIVSMIAILISFVREASGN